MNKSVLFAIGTLTSILMVLVSGLYRQYQPAEEVRPSNDATSASPSASPRPIHNGVFVRIVDVVDGDTVKIEGGEIVRYIGMNTPETVAPGRPIECMGKEATIQNTKLVQGKLVELEKDVSERDRFGRLLRYVWLGDTLINEQLVLDGFARVSTFPPDVKYQQRFLAAERQAMEEGTGLWSGACPTPTPTPRPFAYPVATESATESSGN